MESLVAKRVRKKPDAPTYMLLARPKVKQVRGSIETSLYGPWQNRGRGEDLKITVTDN